MFLIYAFLLEREIERLILRISSCNCGGGQVQNFQSRPIGLSPRQELI